MYPSLILLLATSFAHADKDCCRWLGDLRAFVGVDRSTYLENRGDAEKWGLDGEALYEEMRYNAYFGPALNKTTIETAARGQHVLDAFGSAVFSREPNAFASLTGLRRRPSINEQNLSRANLNAPNRAVVFGDVIRPSTWAALDANARARNIPAYDLILVRPIKALNVESQKFLMDTPPQHRRPFFAFAHLLVNQLWRRTSATGGRVLLQVEYPTRRTREFRAWVNEVKRRGIDISVKPVGGLYEFDDEVVVLTKHPGAPKRLP